MNGAAKSPPPPRSGPTPSVLAIAICTYIWAPCDRFTVATLFRLPRIQAESLLQLPDYYLGSFRSVFVLELFRSHIPRTRLHALICAENDEPLDYVDSVEALQWWKDSGLELRYTEWAIKEASGRGRVDLLRWWKDSGLPLKYDERALEAASRGGHIDVLQWWKDSGLELRYDEFAMTAASREGHVAVLQWWKDSGYDLKYNSSSLKGAGDSAHIKTLQWWRDSGLEVDWGGSRFETASCVTVLDWWEESGLFKEWLNGFNNRREAFEEVLRRGSFLTRSVAVKQWWHGRCVTFWKPQT